MATSLGLTEQDVKRGHVHKNSGGSFLMKSIQHSNAEMKSRVVCSEQALPRLKSIRYVCVGCRSRDSVRCGRGSSCAVLLLLSVATSSP